MYLLSVIMVGFVFTTANNKHISSHNGSLFSVLRLFIKCLSSDIVTVVLPSLSWVCPRLQNVCYSKPLVSWMVYSLREMLLF